MKKIIALILSVLMLVSLCGCDVISNLLEPGSDELVGTKWILWNIDYNDEHLDYNGIRATNELVDFDYSGQIEFESTYNGHIEIMGESGDCTYKLIENNLTIIDGTDIFEIVLEGDRFTLDASNLPDVEGEMYLEFALDDGTLLEGLSGELANTEWVLYNASLEGVMLNYSFLQSFGYTGTLSFKDDATFNVDLALDEDISAEGYYTCWEDGTGADLYSEGELQEITIDDGIMTFELTDDSNTSVEISFVPSDSELLTAAPDTTFDESYDGAIANTVWPLYYIEEAGMRVDSEMLAVMGSSGCISFGDGTYTLELDADVFEGVYVEDGNQLSLWQDGYEILVFERSSGILILDLDGTVLAFAYDTALN